MVYLSMSIYIWCLYQYTVSIYTLYTAYIQFISTITAMDLF